MPFEHAFQYESDKFAQRYLNSFSSQDYCLSRFFERVEPYRDKVHIILVADHSWPVGLYGGVDAQRGASTEHFLIPMLYLPPRDQADKYRHNVKITEPIVGQSDIPSTVLELLSGKPQGNSFAPLLKKYGKDEKTQPPLPETYDDCQVLTQPYDGGIVTVVRKDERVIYKLGGRGYVRTKIAPDFSESLAMGEDEEAPKNYKTFLYANLCKRYRYWQPAGAGEPQAEPHATPHWSF
jgi:hypothetical protein